jgi:hypothetical protein
MTPTTKIGAKVPMSTTHQEAGTSRLENGTSVLRRLSTTDPNSSTLKETPAPGDVDTFGIINSNGASQQRSLLSQAQDF